MQGTRPFSVRAGRGAVALTKAWSNKKKHSIHCSRISSSSSDMASDITTSPPSAAIVASVPSAIIAGSGFVKYDAHDRRRHGKSPMYWPI